MSEEKIIKPPPRAQLFTHREVLEQLMRARGIKKGRWQLIFELGHAAININTAVAEQAEPVKMPAGVVVIQRIGILPVTEMNDLTLDAADLDKPTRRVPKRGSKKK